jgi:putative nucleotidyltransferase with HDIG domain
MAKSLPASPWLLPKLQTALKNPDTTVEETEALIKKDAGLSSAVLRTANSAFFGDSKCDTLHQALLRLGNREIFKVASMTIAGRWLSNSVTGGYGWEPGDLCKHSLCVAIAAEILANESGKVPPDVAYLAGLLHDVGKLALAYACADGFEEVRVHQQLHQCSWREAEKQIFGYDHTDVGGILLESWSYPINLIETALYYPRPSLAGHDHLPLIAHVHAAKHLSLQLGVGVGEEGFTTELDESVFEIVGLTPEMMELAMPKILMAAEKILSAISAGPGQGVKFEG